MLCRALVETDEHFVLKAVGGTAPDRPASLRARAQRGPAVVAARPANR
jgi:hypothetical protein